MTAATPNTLYTVCVGDLLLLFFCCMIRLLWQHTSGLQGGYSDWSQYGKGSIFIGFGTLHSKFAPHTHKRNVVEKLFYFLFSCVKIMKEIYLRYVTDKTRNIVLTENFFFSKRCCEKFP